MMKLIVKKLQGGDCTIEVQPTTLVSEVKHLVASQLKIPAEDQKLLFLGRTLVDEQTLQSYSTIKDGSKLNLVVKKPEDLNDILYKAFIKTGMTDLQARNATNKFLTAIQKNFCKFSLDDIDRLATDCLDEEALKSLREIEEVA